MSTEPDGDPSPPDLVAVFEQVYAAPASKVEQRVWREVFGDEYPEGAAPFSYVSRSELDLLVERLAVPSTGTLVDIGCGRGGPGLWVATRSDANLIGVDIASSALRSAHERAVDHGWGDRSSFVHGGFEHVPLPSSSVDAVMSVDALLFAEDKEIAVREVARVLRPGGRFGFTSWDYRSRPPGRPPQVEDHRPVLERAGFEVLVYDETVDWRERQRRTDELLLAAVDELAAESGTSVDRVRADLESEGDTTEHMLRRIIAIAVRR